jgi:hypothetical protein
VGVISNKGQVGILVVGKKIESKRDRIIEVDVITCNGVFDDK